MDSSYTTARGYMEIVPNRTKETLIPIIERVVANNSIINSDEWTYYRSINLNLYEHGTVRHKLYFLDPFTGIHTQNIESYYNKQKYRSKVMRDVNNIDLKYYLSEWMWRDNIPGNCVEKIFDLIKI
ncbi:hypothetical protein DMUE_5418 [Dictyocoela muelleri]|nr:hypothetical protein DMUE_5418 [Dictyocoela muelleri]